MKVLEDVHHQLKMELPHCKSHHEVEALLSKAKSRLLESQAPLGQKQRMWEDVKVSLSILVRRPEVIVSAHSIIDGYLKQLR